MSEICEKKKNPICLVLNLVAKLLQTQKITNTAFAPLAIFFRSAPSNIHHLRFDFLPNPRERLGDLDTHKERGETYKTHTLRQADIATCRLNWPGGEHIWNADAPKNLDPDSDAEGNFLVLFLFYIIKNQKS